MLLSPLCHCRCPFVGSSCTAFTESLVRTANESMLLLDLMVGEPDNDMDEPFLLGKEMGSCREKAGMGWPGGVCGWCLLQALVSATSLLPISDKLLSSLMPYPLLNGEKLFCSQAMRSLNKFGCFYYFGF